MIDEQLNEVIAGAISAALANVHTATIAKVTNVNEKTIDCKPVINRVVNGESIELPVFAEVLPLFLGGGDNYISHPIKKDDYCLLIFTERCYDRWANGQDFQSPLVQRMHDYSDGVAICGMRKISDLLTIPDETVLNGDLCLGSESPGDYVALGDKTDDEFKRIYDAMNAWVPAPIPGDGGAAVATALKGVFAGASGSRGDVGSTTIKAE